MYRKKLLELGIPASIDGFELLNYAIEIYCPGRDMMGLYDDVATHYGIKRRNAERNMHHAISKLGKKITVKQFITKYKILWEE